MSERPLPDDLAHWPSNPYDLLGVVRNVSPRELRRAYNRLIRVYKPEQFPEQFRRIRAAYESLIPMAEWFATLAEAPASPEDVAPPPADGPTSDDSAPTWAAPNPQPLDEATEPNPLAPRPRHAVDDPDSLWELAVTGRAPAAYERLSQLVQQHAGRSELYLRLYWLLTLWPELDLRRVPADWLVQGLLATGMSGPLRELYQEELADDPAEALGERFGRLLGAPTVAGQLADLIEWRFQAAVRLKRWDVLHGDLARLRPRFGPGEERLWLRLVFKLADGVAWSGEPGGRLMQACVKEIGLHEHLAPSLSDHFDRFDLLREARLGWQILSDQRRVPRAMLQLIGPAWSRPFPEVRALLMEVLELIAAVPRKWLDHLDEMQKRAPATLAVFGEVLDQFESAAEIVRPHPMGRDRLSRLIQRFLARLSVNSYTGMRPHLLAFCLGEAITPEDVAEAGSSFAFSWEKQGAAWAGSLKTDWPLRYLCRACRLFWA